MAEGGDQPPIHHVVNAQTVIFNQSEAVHVVGDNVRKINIRDSMVQEVNVTPGNNGENIIHPGNVEADATDATTSLERSAVATLKRTPSLFDDVQTTEPPEQIAGGNLEHDSSDTAVSATNAPGFAVETPTGTTSLFQNVKSSNPPTGPGWVKLSDTIWMNNQQPLKKGAAVYNGKQKFAGGWRDVAVKLIPYSEKDFNEVKLHLTLEDHPNIIRMLDAGEIHGVERRIYIVTELCPKTLNDFIDENKQAPFDFEQRFSYAKQIVSGIAFIHEKQILHRDIKLENLLLSPSKENIRVADFGLSKQLLEGHSATTASSRGLGTDGYRAPEILSENPKASFYSDTFSLGIVLATMFSNGQHPFGSDPLRWRTNIVDNERLNLSHILQFKSPHSSKRAQLLDLIKRCLKPSPRDRPTPDQMLRHPFFSIASDHSSRNDEPRGFISRMASFFAGSKDSNHDKETDASAMSKPTISSTPLTTSSSTDSPKQGNKTTNNTENQERIKFLEGKLKRPLKEIGYEKSVQLLEELQNLRGSDDLDILLQLAECHLHLMSDKIDSSIAKVEHFISTLRSRSARDVRKMAEDLYENKQLVQAMILYKISHDLHKKEKKSSPDVELEWIRYRVLDINYAIDPLAKEGGTSRDIVKSYGLKYMTDMLSEVREIKNANPDVKALKELSCLASIADIYDEVDEYGKAIELGEAGITMMKQQFKERVSNYKRYGMLLHNLGAAYRNSYQYSKAEHCYVAAIEVKERALDYENEKERRENIERTKGNLKRVRRLLGKQK